MQHALQHPCTIKGPWTKFDEQQAWYERNTCTRIAYQSIDTCITHVLAQQRCVCLDSLVRVHFHVVPATGG